MRRTPPTQPQLAAQGSSRLLRHIHRALGSSVESDALSALAERPDDLAAFWAAVSPAVERSMVRCAADEIRRTADSAARQRIKLPDHLAWLTASGCSREDARQIRYVIEAFYHLEPAFAVLSAAAAKWAESGSVGSWMVPQQPNRPEAPVFIPGLIDFPPTRSEGRFDDYSAPPHPLVRALAVWPDYLRKALSDLEFAAKPEALQEAAVMLYSTIELLVARLPVSAAASTAHRPLLVTRMRRCLEASLEAVVVACALRRGFIRGEVSARNRRILATTP